MLIKLWNESTSSKWTGAFVANSSRITKASNWLCECIFSYPDELPIERLDEYNDLIIKYMGARLGTENIIMAVDV